MNQTRRLIVKDVQKTTAGKVSVPVLPNFYNIFSKYVKGKDHLAERLELEPNNRCTDKSAMTLKPDKDIIAETLISDFLFLGCLS